MTAPSWNLSIAYQNLEDPKIEQDIGLIKQCIEVLVLHVDNCNAVNVMQNAIQTSEAAGKLLATVNTFAQCHASIDATNSQAKALIGRIAKLNSELTQAFTPYENALTVAPDSFINDVLSHDSGDVSGQAFQIECTRKIAATKLSVAEEQLLTAMQVDGRDAWGRLYDNITGSLQVALQDGQQTKVGFSQAASTLYGTDFEGQEPAWRGIQSAMQDNQESFAAILNALAGWRLTEYQKRSKITDVDFLDPSLHESRIQATAAACYQRGRIARNAVRYAEAFEHFLRASQLNPERSEYLVAFAYIAAEQGEFKAAIDSIEKSIEVDTQADSIEGFQFLYRFMSLCILYLRLFLQEGRQEHKDAGMTVLDGLVKGFHQLTGDLEHPFLDRFRALDLRIDAPVEEDNQLIGCVLEYSEQICSGELFDIVGDEEDQLLVAQTLSLIGGMMTETGRDEDHLSVSKIITNRSLAINSDIYPGAHASSAQDLRVLGDTAFKLGDPNEAYEFYAQSRSMLSELYGDEHEQVQELDQLIQSARKSDAGSKQ